MRFSLNMTLISYCGVNKMYVTVAKILDAIEDDGYEQSIGRLVKKGWEEREGIVDEMGYPKYDTIVEYACAMGQAALNLGVDAQELYNSDKLRSMTITYIGSYVSAIGAIVDMNDDKRMSLKDIARAMRKYLTAEQLNKKVNLHKRDYTEFKNWRGVTVK